MCFHLHFSFFYKKGFLEGRVRDGNWTLLDTRANVSFVQHSQTIRFNITPPATKDKTKDTTRATEKDTKTETAAAMFSSYRWTFLAIQNASSVSELQIADISFPNRPPRPPPAPGAKSLLPIKVSITSPCTYIWGFNLHWFLTLIIFFLSSLSLSSISLFFLSLTNISLSLAFLVCMTLPGRRSVCVCCGKSPNLEGVSYLFDHNMASKW